MGMVDGSSSVSHTRVENLLAILPLALVWLAPNHQAPWGSFHHELLMAVALIMISFVVGWQTNWKLTVGVFSRIALLAALLPWLQWMTGILPKSGTALISSSYIAAFGLAVCIGQSSANQPKRRFFFILFGAIALAAVVNVPVQVVQWYQLYDHDLDSVILMLVTPIDASQRPSGMILQPNQLATIQVWGLIGLTWLRYTRSITIPFFLISFSVVVFGLGLTQSRAGLLEMLLVLGLVVFAMRNAYRRDIVLPWFVSVSLLVVWALNFGVVAEWLGVPSMAVARLSAIDGARVDAWRAFWAAVLERPWSGYGISDVGHAYVAKALERPDIYIGQRFGHSHNAVLDLFLWVGLPLALVAVGAFAFWLFQRFRLLTPQPETMFPLAVVAALGVHSMLELPHHFMYFIVPAGFCIGWLCNSPVPSTAWTLPRWAWGAAGGTVAALTILIAMDYFPYQQRYTEWRFENQRVGKRPNIDVHKPIVLNQIHDELVLYRLELSANLSEEKLQWIDETARTVNSPHAFFAAAKAYALVGRRNDALLWMMRFNAIIDPEGVHQIKAIWQKDQTRHPELANLDWPDYQGRKLTFVLFPQDASPNLLPSKNFGTISDQTRNEKPRSVNHVR